MKCRVIQEVQDQGKLDNAIIIYLTGDNGTSAEGSLEGSFNELTVYNGIQTLSEALQMSHYEDWGRIRPIRTWRCNVYAGPGPGKGGTGVLSVAGKELNRKTVEHTIPLVLAIDETFDVGIDTGSGVDNSYNLPFKFTGTI